jgi:hypothetical protein
MAMRAIIDKEAIQVIAKGFIGTAAFESYNYYAMIIPLKEEIKEMKEVNMSLKDINKSQSELILKQTNTINRLEERLNKSWFW